MSEQNTEFAYLDKYNARYNNTAYRQLSASIARCIDTYDFAKAARNPAYFHQEHNEIMNVIIDSAMEKCGATHYQGASVNLAMLVSTFETDTLSQIDQYLARFA